MSASTPEVNRIPLCQKIAEVSHDAILVFAASGETRYLNRAAHLLFGIKPGEPAPGHLSEFIPEDRVGIHQEHIHRFLAGSEESRVMSSRRPVHGRRADGSLFAADISIARLEHDGETLLVSIIRDATEKGELINELLTDVHHDHLTGIANRRRLQEIGHDEFARFQRYGHPFALLMIDIDNFKYINDTYGHLAGDQVIRRVAIAVDECLRECDRVGRWGGEEFQAILPETDLDGAMNVAERIRRRVEEMSVHHESFLIQLSVSIGVDVADRSLPDLEYLVSRADRALYAAKAAGRNCVMCATDLVEDGARPSS